MGNYEPEPIDNPNWSEKQQQAVDNARTADDLGSLHDAIIGGSAKDVADAVIDAFENIMPQLFGPNGDATKELVNGAIGDINEKRDGERQALIDAGINPDDIRENPYKPILHPSEIDSNTNKPWKEAMYLDWWISPLVLDLDGDGVETVGITSDKQVLFDHDGDGVRNGTGWVGKDDGLLVFDRNGNGTIDNGNELFGDQTMVNGTKAKDGFSALSSEDTNGDGKFDANDTNFSNVKVWRDMDGDVLLLVA